MGIMPGSSEKNPEMHNFLLKFRSQSWGHWRLVLTHVLMAEPCTRATHPTSFQDFIGRVFAREGKPSRRTDQEGHYHVKVQGLETWVKHFGQGIKTIYSISLDVRSFLGVSNRKFYPFWCSAFLGFKILETPQPHALRKNFLAEHFAFAHLTGIGGPGAPHVFFLQRFSETGHLPIR